MIRNFFVMALALHLSPISQVQAQPISIAGIYPGKTTLDELKELVEDPKKVEKNDDIHHVSLKALDNAYASILSFNEIVYQVELTLSPEISVLLISKYGKPRRVNGEIKKIVCRNGFGAKFDRLNGERREYWGQKDGVQAVLVHTARGCAEDIHSEYLIYNLAIKKKVDSAQDMKRIKELGSKIDKLSEGI